MESFLTNILPTLRIISTIVAIIVLVSQGPQGEGLLQQLNETRIFASFRETQFFLAILTWGSIGFWEISNFLTSTLGGK
uniref:Hypothetical chloroplast RF47 n=1 Tax=Nephroselmis astigmatica TaxID=259378 RepID=A0A088CIK2_9CHLO|nr:hypothetical chloroplast RF47 [Nephroselmis astigmatica]AID67743.1 hypothetical chloroplast RF47 [Nephroselmis astigmatica]